jgi:integrase
MVTLRAVYNAALKNRLDPGIPPYNPVASVAFNHEERRSTGMSPDELKAWAMQLAKLQNPVRREFHLFTLLSAMRPDALKRAKWAHIDRKRRVLHVPKPKGGERRAFDLPLSREMIRSLCRVSRAGQMYGKNGLTWIFPSEAPDGHIAEHKEKRHILSHWGGDLRQTWRTFALRADLGELAASILMNHSLGSVNAGYISTPALRDHLCACQERVSAKIIEAMALPDMANSFKRDIAARLQDAIAPDQAKSIRARQWFFGRDRP